MSRTDEGFVWQILQNGHAGNTYKQQKIETEIDNM